MTYVTSENLIDKPSDKIDLRSLLNELWMFSQSPYTLNHVLNFVKNGSISVDISNLNEHSDRWDGCINIKLIKISNHDLVSLIAMFVNNCRVSEIKMLPNDVIRFWWD